MTNDYLFFLVGLAILGVLIAILSMLSSIIQHWVSNEGNDTKKCQNAADHESKKQNQLDFERGVGFLPTHIDAVAEAIGAYHNKRDTHERRKSKTDKVTVIILAVTAVFAVIAAGLSGISDWIFYRQLDEMRADQRPWVGLDGIQPIQGANAIYVSITNSGKSPALHTRAIVSGGAIKKFPISIPDRPCDVDCTFTDIVMLPNVPLKRRVPPNGEAQATANDQIWFSVRVDYQDTEGLPHHYRSCLIIIPPYNDTKSCPEPYRDYAD